MEGRKGARFAVAIHFKFLKDEISLEYSKIK
jgi:hypothetical protein